MNKSKNMTIIFLIIIFVYFLFSQFYLKTLGNTFVYIINPLVFIILAIALKFLIPSTYDSKKHKKTILNYTIIGSILYVCIEIFSGLLFSYGKNPYSATFQGLISNFYSIGAIIFLREYIRYKLINNVFKKDKQLIYILIVIVFSMQEISIASICSNLNAYFIFKYIFTVIVPTIIKNCVFTYIVKYTDYIPAVVYEIILYMVKWVSPILPNAEWIFYAVIDSVIPLIVLLYCIYEVTSKDKEHIFRMDKAIEPKGIIPWAVILILVVWFEIGLFPIKPVGILTGSMIPNYNVGDLVIIQKCDPQNIKIDDVVEYRKETYTVIHRVIKKYEQNGKIMFETKGDNNDSKDSDPVSQEQIQGKAIAKVPYLALPRIWLNSLKPNQQNVNVELGK